MCVCVCVGVFVDECVRWVGDHERLAIGSSQRLVTNRRVITVGLPMFFNFSPLAAVFLATLRISLKILFIFLLSCRKSTTQSMQRKQDHHASISHPLTSFRSLGGLSPKPMPGPMCTDGGINEMSVIKSDGGGYKMEGRESGRCARHGACALKRNGGVTKAHPHPSHECERHRR